MSEELKPLNEDLGFCHAWALDSIESLCDKVDFAGGWNPKAESVVFFHGVGENSRTCQFRALEERSG